MLDVVALCLLVSSSGLNSLRGGLEAKAMLIESPQLLVSNQTIVRRKNGVQVLVISL